MKKILLSSIIALASVNGFAQFVTSVDTVFFNAMLINNIDQTPSSQQAILCKITNTSTTDSTTITWHKSNENMLSGWSVASICDIVTCYSGTNANHTFKLGPTKSGTIDLGMKAAVGSPTGCSSAVIDFTDGTTTKSVAFKYCAWPLAIKNYENSNIVSIYPNPASSFVNIILNDKNIASIHVLNIIGKKIAKFDVDYSKSNSMRVPLDNVADGIYMLQFADENGKLLGVRRVTKN
jgi:hypothetical protein